MKKRMKKKSAHYMALGMAMCLMFAASCGKAEAPAADSQAEGSNGTEASDVQQSEKTETDGGGTAGTQQDGAVEKVDTSTSGQPDITDTIPLHVIDDNYRTYYEVFVYSFYDSDGDGIGDLRGLISKLDYINDGDDTTDTDLGCNGIWLMPVHPSPTYHKYDVTDYYEIDPVYGTLEDFREFLAACDERGIKVIMDLVLNHSSSKHPWFQEACSYLRELGDAEPNVADCPYYDYYHFSKEEKDGYYKVSGTDWYYEGQFWSEMPDLNLDCEPLRAEIEKITEYWLDMGVGGFRLAEVKEYYTDGQQENIDFLEWLTDTVKSQKEDAYLVGEAWLNISEYSRYYASGMDSLFNFAFAGAEGTIAKVMNGTSAGKYGTACASLQETFGQYNENFIDAPFYTNHDMARSVGYYVGENSLNRVKMAGAMNLFMSGSAFVYYGEELGMKGSGKDENKRAPMYWSKDPETTGMCDGPADMDDFEMKYDSLEEQQADASSIYQFYKKAIKIRNQNPEIARGKVEYLEEVSGDRVCVLRKTYDGSEVLLVFATGADSETVDLSGVILNGSAVGDDTEVRATLTTGDEPVTIEGGVATLPGYSVLIIV